jgi:hypothetical protein
MMRSRVLILGQVAHAVLVRIRETYAIVVPAQPSFACCFPRAWQVTQTTVRHCGALSSRGRLRVLLGTSSWYVGTFVQRLERESVLLKATCERLACEVRTTRCNVERTQRFVSILLIIMSWPSVFCCAIARETDSVSVQSAQLSVPR